MSFIFVCSVLLSIKLTARRDIKSFFNGTFTRIVASFQRSAWRQRIPSIRISFEHSKNLNPRLLNYSSTGNRLRKSWPPLSVETTVHFSSPTPSTRAFHAHRSYSAPLRRDEIFKKTPINFDRVLVSRQKVEKKNEEIQRFKFLSLLVPRTCRCRVFLLLVSRFFSGAGKISERTKRREFDGDPSYFISR